MLGARRATAAGLLALRVRAVAAPLRAFDRVALPAAAVRRVRVLELMPPMLPSGRDRVREKALPSLACETLATALAGTWPLRSRWRLSPHRVRVSPARRKHSGCIAAASSAWT
ncbi:MAG: hypothetical protein U0168_29420 [Nannocystaceae bacterium]